MGLVEQGRVQPDLQQVAAGDCILVLSGVALLTNGAAPRLLFTNGLRPAALAANPNVDADPDHPPHRLIGSRPEDRARGPVDVSWWSPRGSSLLRQGPWRTFEAIRTETIKCFIRLR